MKKPCLNSLRFIPVTLGLALALLAYNAKAASSYFTPSGGVGNGSTYTWDDPTVQWSTASSGTPTESWTAAQVNSAFPRFYEGTAGWSYTVNIPDGSSENMAGLYNHVALTLNITATGSGNMSIASGLQGFLGVSGANTYIYAPMTGSGGFAPETTGHTIYLYGNNSFSGGTTFGFSGSPLVYFNNNNAFGTGLITDSYASGGFQGILSSGGSTITLANNWTTTVSGNGINFANGASTPVITTGTWTLGANNINIRNNGNSTAPLTISGAISSTGGGVTFDGANGGKIILNAVNSYTGPTTIGSASHTAVTLQLGVANAIASSSSLIMGGPTFNPGGFSQAMRSTTLGLTASSTIDFGAGATEVDFANSSGVAWTSGQTLNLLSTGGGNWNNSSDFLEVGTDATGLTAAQLAEIEFNGIDLGDAAINSAGYVYDLNQAPEPSTALLGLLGLGALRIIRRRTA